MFDFLDKDAVDIILSAEVIFSVVCTFSLFVLVHALLSFMKHSGPLYTRMAQVEAEITVLQASIPVKVEQIAALRHSLQPLQSDFRQLRTYHARLTYIEKKAVEDEIEREREGGRGGESSWAGPKRPGPLYLDLR